MEASLCNGCHACLLFCPFGAIVVNRTIQELSGCGIAMHTIDRHFIETKNEWSTWWRYYDQEADF